MQFLIQHYSDHISLPQLGYFYPHVYKDNSARLIVVGQIKSKLEGATSKDKAWFVNNLKPLATQDLKKWIDTIISIFPNDINQSEIHTRRNPLHTLIDTLQYNSTISQDLEYVLDVFSKNKDLEAMKNGLNSEGQTPMQYLESLGSKVNDEIKSKIIEKLFPEKKAS